MQGLGGKIERMQMCACKQYLVWACYELLQCDDCAHASNM